MKNKFALWSFIFSMLGFIVFTICYINGAQEIFVNILLVSLILFPIALVLGIIGIKRSKEQGGKALAIIGIILGGLFSLYYLIWFLIPKRL